MAEFVREIGSRSRFSFDLLNLWGGRHPRGLELPRSVRLSGYDGLFIHSAVSYNADNLLSLDRSLVEKIDEYEGLKVMMKQDEHFRTHRIVEYLATRRFDLLLTCVPPESLRLVYPAEKLPDIQFLHALTGYVSDGLRRRSCTPQSARTVDVGYRGSPQPFHFGRLCYEKQQIGEAFRGVCCERGLKCDISSRWEDRFHGEEWFEFLGRLKGVLGVESGASVFDFDGEVERACSEYIRSHHQADFEEVHAAVLAPHEGRVHYNQVSPRHFEAAACRTVQILYEGEYSGIFRPGRHFLELKRDFSNVDDVLDRLADPGKRTELTEAAYEEVVLNDEYHYAKAVERLDDAIEGLFGGLGSRRRPRSGRLRGSLHL